MGGKRHLPLLLNSVKYTKKHFSNQFLFDSKQGKSGDECKQKSISVNTACL